MFRKATRSMCAFILAIYAFTLIPLSGTAQAAPTLPAGYSLTPLANNLGYPNNLAWLPDGTMLISEKGGIVKALRNGVPQTIINISSSTSDYWDRGMLGITIDPEYATNRYIYLLRVLENNPEDREGPKTSQLVRVTMNADSTQVVAGSLTVLLGTQNPRSCEDLPVGADCIPADGSSHSVGDVVFAPDGTLFLTNGDNAAFHFDDPLSLRSQNLDSLSGKLIHIDRNGKGLPTNPFFNGDINANRSKVYSYGFRNPWRLAFKPGTTTPYIAEVGSDNFEEINVARPGDNFGWPCYEGNEVRNAPDILYGCQPLYDRVASGQATVKNPLVQWGHAGGGAAIGGTFVTGTYYPAALQGSYVYGDYVHQWARSLKTDANHQLTSGPTDLIAGLPGIVNIEQGPDGRLYVVTIADATTEFNTGQVFRLDYQDAAQACPVGQFKAEYYNTATLSGPIVTTRCETAPLNNQWGGAAPVAGVNADNFSTRWTGTFNFEAGNHQFNVSADDGVRLYVDGVQVIDGWRNQSETAYQANRELTAGPHVVTIEYYDSGEDATLRANWSNTTQPSACPFGQFKAEYYNTTTLSGPVAVSRCETAPLNHNWGAGTPTAGVNADNFSTRWTGTFNLAAGDYQFSTTADDGVRLYVDGAQVINGWRDQSATQYQANRTLAAGQHTIVIEYYDSGEDAVMQASWLNTSAPSTCSAGQFTAEYFNNLSLTGTPAVSRCETAPLNHGWGTAAPAVGVNADNFSGRWTGTFDFAAGEHRFTVRADDGVRLLVDGTPVIDGWRDQSETQYQGARTLTAGSHVVTIEFYDSGEDAALRASWEPTNPTNLAPTPTIVLPTDNMNVAIGSRVSFEGYATDLEDGTIPASNLTWSATIQHCTDNECHAHFLDRFTGANGSFIYPDHGQDDYFVELSLTATDSQGLQSTRKVRLNPDRTACAPGLFKAEYFNNKTLSGQPVASTCTASVNYDWAYNAPLANVNANNFSARFTTTQSFTAGTYRFSVTGDDGIRLFVNNTLLINGWRDQSATTYTQNTTLSAANHTLRLEFYEAEEDAVARLNWVRL